MSSVVQSFNASSATNKTRSDYTPPLAVRMRTLLPRVVKTAVSIFGIQTVATIQSILPSLPRLPHLTVPLVAVTMQSLVYTGIPC
ncbi:hypothetical protein EG68_10035 [Paragonimus skrjabini miyazakii]|uniref:Uncharacterized protein n=1 Tax=Paragonimus skrjabini miyazakii TaxID=59628 RepID=A0A8S9YP07_9TREM|nr:hypothetical protein EG68_10035 [Paragonimus skrjabini miyazakii]